MKALQVGTLILLIDEIGETDGKSIFILKRPEENEWEF